MKCSNCGTEIEEGSLFCTGCGKKVSEMVQEDLPTVTVDEEILDEIEIPQQENSTGNPEPTPVQKTATQEAKKTAQKSTEQQTVSDAGKDAQTTSDPDTKKKYRLIGIIAVVVIAVAAVLVVMFMKRGSGSTDSNEKKLVYEQDGVLYYIPNMDKDADPIEIDETRDDNYWLYEFSPSGKYLYYQELDDRSTLCRVELARLKADSKNNSNYIQEIDTKVMDYTLMDDERLIYRDNDRTLYYYDGKEETDIDDEVSDYYYNADTIYYNVYRDDDDDPSYYYYDTASGDGDCIIKNAYALDFDYETGSCYVEDGDEVYLVNKDGEEERVLNGVDSVVDASVKNKRIYFTRERSIEKTLYDFVDDPYLSEDQSVGGEPDAVDYLTEVPESTALSEVAQNFLAEFPEDRYSYLADRTYWIDTLQMDEYYNEDDEQDYYFDPAPEKWYTCDWDSYYADQDAYESATERDELRSALKDETYTWNYSDLYVWNQGSDEQELVESIDSVSLGVDNDHQILYYQKAASNDGALNNKISIDNVYNTDSVREWLNADYGYDDSDEDYDDEESDTQPDETCYVMVGTKEQEMDVNVDGMQVSENGKTAIIWADEDGDSAIYDYDVTADGLKEAGEINGDVFRGSWVGDSYYYMTDDDEYGDLCVYKNQKSTTLAKNISTYQFNVYADGNVCAYKDYEDMDLRLFDSNGTDTKISKDVQNYSYINANRIVYEKNDNLYVYNGKDEDRRIVRNLSDEDGYLCFTPEAVF